MAELHRSVAGLRIFGDSVDPTEISKLLGCAPTKGQKKGEIRPSKSGREFAATTGAWHLDASSRNPGDLDAQIDEIFSQLTPDLSIWASLGAHHRIDLFCGFFMDEKDEGIEISAASMKILSDRGIKIGICIYAPTPG